MVENNFEMISGSTMASAVSSVGFPVLRALIIPIIWMLEKPALAPDVKSNMVALLFAFAFGS